MYLLLLLQYFLVVLSKQISSEGTYFSMTHKTLYQIEVIMVIPHTSMVQCLLRCKAHIACHDVAMDKDGQCFLLRNDTSDEEKTASGKILNATRVSPIVMENTKVNGTHGGKG